MKMLKFLSLLCYLLYINHPIPSIVSAQPQENPLPYKIMIPNYVPVELYQGRNDKLVSNGNNQKVPCESRRAAPVPSAQDVAEWTVPPLKWRSVLPIETSKHGAKQEKKPQPQVIPILPSYQPSVYTPEHTPNPRLATPSPVGKPVPGAVRTDIPWTLRNGNSMPEPQPVHTSEPYIQRSPKPDNEEFDSYTNGLMDYLSKDTNPGFNPLDDLSHVNFAGKPVTVNNIRHPVETKCILDPNLPSGRRFLSHEINNDPKLLSSPDNLKMTKTANGSGITTEESKFNETDRHFLPVRKSGTIETSKPINSTYANRLLEPTKGPGISLFSRSAVSLIETSRICYACSTKHDVTCWTPSRSTTVKYCSKGREACVIRHYQGVTDGESLVIRDCSSDCESMSLGGLKYKSCSICRDNLCNDQKFESNSSSAVFIPIDIMLACLLLVCLKQFNFV